MTVIVDRAGCCPGCERCYGMTLGCHLDPCRCGPTDAERYTCARRGHPYYDDFGDSGLCACGARTYPVGGEPVFAIANARTNAEVIEQLVRVGYLDAEWRTLDATYGEGRFWTVWRPDDFVACDLNPAKSPIGRSVDFRPGMSGFASNSFDVVVVDGPYKLNGTSSGDGASASDESYGVEAWDGLDGRHALLGDMLREGHRVLRPARRPVPGTRRTELVGGYLLFKCQDQVNGGKFRWQTRIFADLGESLGLRLVAQVHLMGYREQPRRCVCRHTKKAHDQHAESGGIGCPRCDCTRFRLDTSQDHPRQNYSTLLIFRDESLDPGEAPAEPAGTLFE